MCVLARVAIVMLLSLVGGCAPGTPLLKIELFDVQCADDVGGSARVRLRGFTEDLVRVYVDYARADSNPSFAYFMYPTPMVEDPRVLGASVGPFVDPSTGREACRGLWTLHVEDWGAEQRLTREIER